ncbi:MAG: SDR family oxidoreductase [Propioniciclava sp.]
MEQHPFSLKTKVTIVTGGRQGIGKVVAHRLAEAGSDIAILDLADAADVAAEVADQHGVRAMAVTCDVTRPEAVADAVATVAARLGTVDHLFNNAGIVTHKAALDCTEKDFTDVININLNGVFFVAQAVARYLVSQGKPGNIVNTASMSGHIVNVPQEQASYNASKAGVIHLTKSLAVEWADLGIRVNCISPGYIMTEMTGSVREDWRQLWTGLIPAKRMGTPEELAGAVVYLLSGASSYTTGADLVMDGGFTLP